MQISDQSKGESRQYSVIESCSYPVVQQLYDKGSFSLYQVSSSNEKILFFWKILPVAESNVPMGMVDPEGWQTI